MSDNQESFGAAGVASNKLTINTLAKAVNSKVALDPLFSGILDILTECGFATDESQFDLGIIKYNTNEPCAISARAGN